MCVVPETSSLLEDHSLPHLLNELKVLWGNVKRLRDAEACDSDEVMSEVYTYCQSSLKNGSCLREYLWVLNKLQPFIGETNPLDSSIMQVRVEHTLCFISIFTEHFVIMIYETDENLLYTQLRSILYHSPNLNAAYGI